jgi:PAS domain S-box-containing protein
MPNGDSNSEEQKSAEAEVEGFRRDLGPFVVATETTRMPMVFTDARETDNPIIFANDAFLELTGYARAEVLGQSVNFLMVDGANVAALALIRDEFKGQPDTPSEVRYRRKDGRIFWATLFVSPVRDENGNIIQHFASFVDLTAYKEAQAQSGIRQDELVLAQKAAERLSQQLLDTFESIRDAIVTVDRTWRIVMVNSEGARLLGQKASKLVGQKIWKLFPEVIGNRFWDNYHLAMSAGVTVRFTEWSPLLSKWLSVSVFPSEEGLSIYFYDATETRNQETQLRLLESAVERINDVVIITDASTAEGAVGAVIVFVNDAFVEVTGYSRTEVIGKSPRVLQGPKTQRDRLDQIRAAIIAEQTVKVELINYTKTGKEFWTEMDIAPIWDDTGNLTHYVSIQRDISDRREAEAESRLNLERFRLAAEATTDVIWDWDIANDTIWWSGAMERVYLRSDHPDPKNRGDLWEEGLHPDDRERVPAGLLRVVNSEGSRWEDEYRFIRGDGTVAEVMDRGFIIRAENGTATRVIGSMTDLSRQRDLEARLRQSQRLEAVGQLTGGIAHDFNNLLTVILGNAEVLSEGLPDRPELKKLADMTVTAAERGSGLTRRLLAFASQQSLDPKALDVNVLILGMKGMLVRTLSANIDVKYNLGENLWTVKVDPGQLENAILNLVINSRDALPNGGNIVVTTSNITADDRQNIHLSGLASTEFVKVSVSDDGTGMPPEVAERAFDPFFTTKNIDKGNGLGLSMVYGFSRQSGGVTTLTSVYGVGSTVKLYLPRTEALIESVKPPPTSIAQVKGTAHILLVEDDAMVMEYAFAQLISLGYRVSTAKDGEEALAVLKKLDNVDLLFSDVIMPGRLNGFDLAVEAQKQRPGLKILLTSGYSQSNMLDSRGELGHISLLNKPYRRAELATCIESVLEPV